MDEITLKASKRETPPEIRSPLRLDVDYVVDRSEVEVQQCMELTDTNKPKA